MIQPLPIKTLHLLALAVAVFMIVLVMLSAFGNPLACKPVGEVCRQIIVRDSLQGFPGIGMKVRFKTTAWMKQCGIEAETVDAMISGYVFNYFRAHQYPAFTLLITYQAPDGYDCATEFAAAPELVDWDLN